MENENVISQTAGSLGKKIFIQELKNNIDNIESVSTVYQKIDTETRYKITIIISKECHYDDF
jgi:hypothetical protein